MEGRCHCGAIGWRFDGVPPDATACNCTICRRYGTLWAYGHEGEGVDVSGETRSYAYGTHTIDFHFCAVCGCVGWWRHRKVRDGHRRIGVNLRLAEPQLVAAIPIDHFDGLGRFADLPRDGRCVRDMWF